MGEITEYLKEKYSKSRNNETQELMNKQRVKNTILSVCDKYLIDADDELTFEVEGKDIQYAVVVIVEEPIISKYDIAQISNTLFVAKLKELEL